jgi:hypothetical protein
MTSGRKKMLHIYWLLRVVFIVVFVLGERLEIMKCKWGLEIKNGQKTANKMHLTIYGRSLSTFFFFPMMFSCCCCLSENIYIYTRDT